MTLHPAPGVDAGQCRTPQRGRAFPSRTYPSTAADTEDCPLLANLADTGDTLADHQVAIPEYLRLNYWWAYVHPAAVRVFERGWLVDLILWGNYRTLSASALAALGDTIDGRTLQIACVYGDLTPRLAERVTAGHGALDVVDVLPVQLDNLRRKLPADSTARLLEQDSSALAIADATYDRALLFFLLHEQPAEVRARTVAEALRVVKPGGKLVMVDFARPQWWHPLRYSWLPLISRIEPFAADMWRGANGMCLPCEVTHKRAIRRFFGGMFQMVTLTRG